MKEILLFIDKSTSYLNGLGAARARALSKYRR